MEEQMKTLTVIDTDILIDAAMKISEAVHCLDETEQRVALAISGYSACRKRIIQI